MMVMRGQRAPIAGLDQLRLLESGRRHFTTRPGVSRLNVKVPMTALRVRQLDGQHHRGASHRSKVHRRMGVGHFADLDGAAVLSDKGAADFERMTVVTQQRARSVPMRAVELGVAGSGGHRQRDVITAPHPGQRCRGRDSRAPPQARLETTTPTTSADRHTISFRSQSESKRPMCCRQSWRHRCKRP